MRILSVSLLINRRARILLPILLVQFLFLYPKSIEAKKLEFMISNNDISTIVNRTAKRAHIIKIPAFENALEGLRLEYATLEFYINSSSNDKTGIPYILTIAACDSCSLTDSTFSAVTNIETGTLLVANDSSDRVYVDVTNIIKYWYHNHRDDMNIVIYNKDADSSIISSLISDAFESGIGVRLIICAVKWPRLSM